VADWKKKKRKKKKEMQSCIATRILVLIGAKRDRSPMYPKSCTHHFKITERRGELFELENGGSDEAARAPTRAATSPRYA